MKELFEKHKKVILSVLLLVVMIIILGISSCNESKNSVSDSHEGEAQAPSASSVLKGSDYQKAVDMFANSGFTNIKTEVIEDLVFGWLTEDGEIESVSISGDENYNSGNWYPKDTEVLITYHTFPIKEETESIESQRLETASPAPNLESEPAKKNEEITEAPETTTEETVTPTKAPTETTGVVLPKSGSKLDKDLDTQGSSTIYYINVDGTSNVPKLANWGGAVVTDSVSEYLDYLESLGYKVSITGTDYREPYAGFHTYDTDFKVENSTASWTMSLYIQDEKYVEYELDVNIP